MPDPDQQKEQGNNKPRDVSTTHLVDEQSKLAAFERVLQSGNPEILKSFENRLENTNSDNSLGNNTNFLEAMSNIARNHLTNLAGSQLNNNLYNNPKLGSTFPKLQEVFNLAMIEELGNILSSDFERLKYIDVTFIGFSGDEITVPAIKFITQIATSQNLKREGGSPDKFVIKSFSRKKEFVNPTPTLVPNPQTPRQLEDPQLEKNVKFNAYTNSRENGKIAWSVEVDTENAFYVEDKDGNRKFVVITMKGIAEDNKEINLSQAFYQSTGVNSGHEGEWFPCRGVSPTDIMDKYIVKHINTNAPKYLSNGNSRMPNPLTRMGSFEFILSHGGIFNEISNELSKHNIKTTKNIPYEQINTELKNISPDVDLEFQPETDNTIIPIPQPTRPLS
jgi:hypothetical protein